MSTKSQFLNNCKTRTEHDREFIFTSQFNGRSEAEIDTRTEHLLYVHRKKRRLRVDDTIKRWNVIINNAIQLNNVGWFKNHAAQ